MRRPLLRQPIRRAAWIAALVSVACGQDGTPTDPFGPGEEPASSLNIVAAAPDAAPVEEPSVSFWAFEDRRSEGRIRLADQPGQGRGHEYLRLTIPQGALLARPDGSPFAQRDSVLITVRVADPARILFQMEPAGLRFDPAHMAELRIRYDIAGGDLDRNGRHDTDDEEIEAHLGIWRQATENSPFVRLESIATFGNHEVRASLPGFSRYAIAY